MNSASARRWIPLSGIVYVVLFIIGFSLAEGSPQASDPDSDFVSYYADSGNRTQEIVAFFLIVLAALAFLKFVAHLRGRLKAVESEPHSLSTLAFGAGIASATLLMAAVSIGIGPSFTRADSDQFTIDPDTIRLSGDTSYLLLVSSVMVTSLLIAATSLLAIRTTVLPTWLGWIGLLVAVAALFAVFFLPIIALLAWVLVVAVVLIIRPQASDAESTPTSPRPV